MVKNRDEMTAVVNAVRKSLCLSVARWVRLKKGKAAEGREGETAKVGDIESQANAWRCDGGVQLCTPAAGF